MIIWYIIYNYTIQIRCDIYIYFIGSPLCMQVYNIKYWTDRGLSNFDILRNWAFTENDIITSSKGNVTLRVEGCPREQFNGDYVQDRESLLETWNMGVFTFQFRGKKWMMKNIFFLWSLALWVFSLGTEMLPTRKPTRGREILQPSAHLLLSRERLLYVLSCWEQAVVHLLARLPIFVLSCEDLARASHGGPSMVSLESEGQSLREVSTDGLQIAHSRGADCFGTRHYPHELRANCSLLVWSARCRWQQEEHCSWTQWVLQKDRGDEERPSCLSSLEWEVQ